MIKKNIVPILAILALGLLVGCGAGNLDQGQVKYTPGVPPWQEKDPAKKGVGGVSSGGTGGAQPGQAPTDAANTPGETNQAPPGGGPPGLQPPTRGL